MASIELSLPETATGSSGTKSLLRDLDPWLDNLPYAAVDDACGELLQRLRRLNRHELAPGTRLEAMEGFHTAYRRLHDPLIDERSSRTQRSANPEKEQRARALREEMSVGYKHAAGQLADARAGQREGSTALAIQRALNYLSLYLVDHYQNYDLAQPSLWREISSLYRYAEQQQLLQDPVAGAVRTEPPATIAGTFKQIAFLRLSDPYRLPPGTVWDVYHYLGLNEDKIRLQSPSQTAARAGILLLDLEGDSTRDTTPRDADRYWLNGRALVRHLSDGLNDLQQGGLSSKLGFSERITRLEAIQLGVRLLNLWARTPQRVMPRFSGTGTIHVMTGFSAICDRVAQSNRNLNPDSGAIRCTRINRSTGGLALECAEEDGRNVHVGQVAVVQLAASGGGTQWQPAIVRWLLRPDREHTRFGIQYIGEQLSAIRIRTSGSGRDSGSTQSALHVSLRHGGQTLTTVIAPCGIFRPGRHIELFGEGNSTMVRCTKLIESLATAERFSYQPLKT